MRRPKLKIPFRPYLQYTRKNFSGKFITRVPPSLHERIAAAATAAGMSLNQWVQIALEREATHS